MPGETVGLTELAEGLRRRWPLAVLVAAPLFGSVVGYAESLPTSYESRAVVTLAPRPDTDVSSDVVRVVTPKYVAYLDSLSLQQEVGRSTGQPLDELRSGVDVSIAPETANLEIVVELGSPQAAAANAAELARRAVQLSENDRLLTAEILVPPVAVSTPSGPPRRAVEGAGLLLALLAGTAVAVLADQRQPRTSSLRDLSMTTGLPALAAFPNTRSLRRRPAEALDDPLVSAAVGTLLVRLDSESAAAPVRSLAVTSPSPGDGKTTVAAAIAAGLTRLGSRVLLLDADLGRPAMSDQLRLGVDGDGPGLVELLQGKASLGAVTVTAASSTLSTVPSRAHPESSALVARRLGVVIADATQRFDFVIVDCPPVSVADARLITTMCDATLLVVDRGSRREQASAAATMLHGLRVRVIGTVLNRAGRASGRHVDVGLDQR